MKRSLLTLLFVAAALVTNAAGIKWHKAYEAAKTEAKSSGRLIMIDFYTDWCVWCKKLDSDTYPAPEVVAQSEKFVPIKLDAEKDPEGVRLAKKFKVTGYPTVIFIDANEALAYKIVGYSGPKEFAGSMSKASLVREQKTKFEAILKSNPNDFKALVGMASVSAGTGDLDRAGELTDRAAKVAKPADRGMMLDTFNATGDGFQNNGQVDKAVPYFEKAIDDNFPKQTAYARVSIATCYVQSEQAKKAIPYLEALLKMGKEADQYRDMANQMLAVAKKG